MDLQNGSYKPMSVTDWVITFIISYIPLVGIVMLFVWAFGDGTHPSKKTWAQALLIFALIMFVLGIIFFIIFWTVIASMFAGFSTYS